MAHEGRYGYSYRCSISGETVHAQPPEKIYIPWRREPGPPLPNAYMWSDDPFLHPADPGPPDDPYRPCGLPFATYVRDDIADEHKRQRDRLLAALKLMRDGYVCALQGNDEIVPDMRYVEELIAECAKEEG